MKHQDKIVVVGDVGGDLDSVTSKVRPDFVRVDIIVSIYNKNNTLHNRKIQWKCLIQVSFYQRT